MYEEYQIEIPQSFMALFIDPGRQKPNACREVVAGLAGQLETTL